jgi:hypothetical protein
MVRLQRHVIVRRLDRHFGDSSQIRKKAVVSGVQMLDHHDRDARIGRQVPEEI